MAETDFTEDWENIRRGPRPIRPPTREETETLAAEMRASQGLPPLPAFVYYPVKDYGYLDLVIYRLRVVDERIKTEYRRGPVYIAYQHEIAWQHPEGKLHVADGKRYTYSKKNCFVDVEDAIDVIFRHVRESKEGSVLDVRNLERRQQEIDKDRKTLEERTKRLNEFKLSTGDIK